MALERALERRRRDDAPGQATGRVVASGDGWRVSDVICTSGPHDRPFEEQHTLVSIAIVAAGSFQYRSTMGRELMTPGALLLGNAGHCFECGHEHGVGDRCLAFQFTPECFARLASDAGVRGGAIDFRLTRLPPVREMSALVARACAGLARQATDEAAGPRDKRAELPWEELAVTLAARTIQLARGLSPSAFASVGAGAGAIPARAAARVTRIVRAIERQPQASLALGRLARAAGLSPYHFLRTFERLTGVTPHQYVLRVRLREAALRLAAEPAKVLDIALDSGFGDVSNFNRAFRAEFGLSPRAYRERLTHGASSSSRRASSEEVSS